MRVALVAPYDLSVAGGVNNQIRAQASALSALTIRLADEKYQRLKDLSRRRRISVNRLIDEMTTQMLAEFDAETRFLLRAERERKKAARGIRLLQKAKGVRAG